MEYLECDVSFPNSQAEACRSGKHSYILSTHHKIKREQISVIGLQEVRQLTPEQGNQVGTLSFSVTSNSPEQLAPLLPIHKYHAYAPALHGFVKENIEGVAILSEYPILETT
jgi:hypothetical protein